MTGLLFVLCAVVCLFISAVTGALGYALRDFSRSKLDAVLTSRGRGDRLDPLVEHSRDFMLLAASVRIFSILLLMASLLKLADSMTMPDWSRYLAVFVVAALLSTVFAVGVASSMAAYFGEHLIARLDRPMHLMRSAFWPVLVVLHGIDSAVFRLSPSSKQNQAEEAEQLVEQEILAVVEAGEKEGVVDETDREMIESVIQFRDTTAGQIMTARPDIVALPVGSSLKELVEQIETSGHSRLPIYERDLDHIVGILYARDLITILGRLEGGDPEMRAHFDLSRCLRQPTYIPETKSLKDLLREFRLRKVHLAIVLDEFGGTAGLITIEDVLEELVGEISDEHEPTTRAAIQKLDDAHWDVDARTYIDEVNTVIGLTIPEDEGYETLGGYISSVLGRIPAAGEEFETPMPGGAEGVIHWHVIDAEPTRVNRLKVSLRPVVAVAEAETEPVPSNAR